VGEERWVGNVTIISRGDEISIARGRGEMVRVLSHGRFFCFVFVIMRYLFLGIQTLIELEL